MDIIKCKTLVFRRSLTRLVIFLFFFGLFIPGCNKNKTGGENILDKQQVLNKQEWWDNKDWSWYKNNIPFFDSPDSGINEIYYYRWELITKHLVYGSPQTGYTFTEFMDRPFWSGTYGAISCPLGHQFYEVRWLKNDRIIRDFASYWFETPGAEPRSYSNWYGDSMWGIYKVKQDKNFLKSVYPYMKKQYHGFVKEHYNPEYGMFMWDGMHDGMEVNINSRQTEDRIRGGDGYRPTLNSYMYADLKALSKASNLLRHSELSKEYDKKAQKLKKRVQEELWDPDRNFFFHQFAFDELNGIKARTLTYETGKYAGSPHGREQIGFVPWQFNLPDQGYAEAWKYLMDKDYFYSEYGPTTVEQNDPLFKVSKNCCVWSGNSWPYATTQTLVAMANLLHNYEQDVVSKEDYFKLLKTYTKTHHKNGRPYIAEAANPYTGSWKGHDHYYHSEHYFHSGYVNNVITGLVGLRPRKDDTIEVNPQIPDSWDYFALEDIAYHGHNVSIVWDRDGTKYNRGKGLMIFVDGEKVVSADEIQRLKTHIDAVPDKSPPKQQPVNFAVNNGRGFFPYISASYSKPDRMPFYANDGSYWYHESPANRWTTEGSTNDREWIKVNYGIERPVKKVKLYFLDDGKGIVPPESYEVQVWAENGWRTVEQADRSPEKPTGRRANIVEFAQVQNTSKVRVLMKPKDGEHLGLTEIETWGKAGLPLDIPTAQVENLAYNPDNEQFPILSASYTHRGADVGAVGDMKGMIPYNSGGKWTARDSDNEEDWVEIHFGPRKKVQKIDILFWGFGNRVGAPEDYRVEYREDSQWKKADIKSRNPEKPVSLALNSVTLEKPVRTHKIRLVFNHTDSTFTGVSEIMVWSNSGN